MLSFARTPQPYSFRKWIDLETKKSKFIEAAEKVDFPDRVFDYLSAALGIPVRKLEKKDWRDSALSLQKAYQQFLPPDIPIIKAAPKDSKEVDWHYDGRTWAFYSHLLAKAYGWTLEYIADLEVGEALSHLQEILTDDQLEREFYHSLSEVAYKYDKGSKKSSYVPMKRPYWMLPVYTKEPKKFKIRRDLLPVGVIKNAHGLPEEEFKSIATEKIKP